MFYLHTPVNYSLPRTHTAKHAPRSMLSSPSLMFATIVVAAAQNFSTLSIDTITNMLKHVQRLPRFKHVRILFHNLVRLIFHYTEILVFQSTVDSIIWILPQLQIHQVITLDSLPRLSEILLFFSGCCLDYSSINLVEILCLDYRELISGRLSRLQFPCIADNKCLPNL